MANMNEVLASASRWYSDISTAHQLYVTYRAVQWCTT